jgi:hypothetical protein
LGEGGILKGIASKLPSETNEKGKEAREERARERGGGGDSEREGEGKKRVYSQALDTLTYHYPPLEQKGSSQEG